MLETEAGVCSSHSIRKMKMAKSKKEHKGQPNGTNSGELAATEERTNVALTAEQPHQVVRQPDQGNSHDEFDMAIRELAYLKWEAAGFPESDGIDFWLEAEREVKMNPPVPVVQTTSE
jgi:hypothetical protein